MLLFQNGLDSGSRMDTSRGVWFVGIHCSWKTWYTIVGDAGDEVKSGVDEVEDDGEEDDSFKCGDK